MSKFALRSKIAEMDMYHGIKFSKQSFLGLTNSSINNNFGLHFWMKTMCKENNVRAYVYYEYTKI